MKRLKFAIGALSVAVILLAWVVGMTYARGTAKRDNELATASQLSDAFVYQGKLMSSDDPVNAVCDMAFRLYDASVNGNQVGTPLTMTVPITDGLFNTRLDFGGSAFTGDARWLGVQVRCPGDAFYADLDRQELTAAPYALYAVSAGDADYATSAGTAGYATTAGSADHATTAGDADYATDAGNAEYATTAGDADYATTAGDADYATAAGNADYATAAGNADTVDSVHASSLARIARYGIPGYGGTVTMTIPHYAAFQITIGEAFGTPDSVAWLAMVENDYKIAWTGILPSGAVITGKADLDSTDTIITLGSGITLRCPGEDSYSLVLTSDMEDVRATVTW